MSGFLDTDEWLRSLSALGGPCKMNDKFSDSDAPVSSFISAVLAFAWRTTRT
jgi:hypothetical protein